MTRREILRAHYVGLMRKIGAVAGVAALLTATLVAVPANAAQITARKMTLGSSTTLTSTTHAYDFTLPTTGNVGSIRFLYCTTALGSCTTPSGLVTTTATLTNQTGATGFSIDTADVNGSPYITRTASSITGPLVVSYTLSNVTNPTAVNTTFYIRVSSYASTDTTGGTTDTGTVAVSTTLASPNFQVNANVAESLIFCVGQTGTSCSGGGALTGTAVTLAPDPMGSTAVSYGTAKMVAATNGISGYTIAYHGTDMATGAGPTITKAADAGAVSTPGTEQFGFTLTNQTSGGLNGQGSAPSGGTGITLDNDYDNANSTIAYDITGPDTVATASGPTTETVYTMLYAANVATTTEPGAYSANQTYIATATF